MEQEVIILLKHLVHYGTDSFNAKTISHLDQLQ